MISTVIFDADGVLINGKKFKDVRNRELQINSAKEQEFFGGVFQDCLIGEADLKQSITEYLPHFGWTNTPNAFLDYWFQTEHSIDERFIPIIRQLRAKGITVVLATNQEKYRTAYMMNEMEFDDLFDTIYSSAHIGFKKPDHKFYDYIIQDRGENKAQVLFWDDDTDNIKGADSYGINAQLYQGFEPFVTSMKAYGLL